MIFYLYIFLILDELGENMNFFYFKGNEEYI